jgi:hypothetical protein
LQGLVLKTIEDGIHGDLHGEIGDKKWSRGIGRAALIWPVEMLA